MNLPQKFETRLVYQIMASDLVPEIVEATKLPIKDFTPIYDTVLYGQRAITFMNNGAPFVFEIAENADGSLDVIRERPVFPWEYNLMSPAFNRWVARNTVESGGAFWRIVQGYIHPSDIEFNLYHYRTGTRIDDDDGPTEKLVRFRPVAAPDCPLHLHFSLVAPQIVNHTVVTTFNLTEIKDYAPANEPNVRGVAIGLGPSRSRCLKAFTDSGYILNETIPPPTFNDSDRFKTIYNSKGKALVRRRLTEPQISGS
jgi:hypothetical protein